MNDHRLSRLKRLAAGAALVTATAGLASDPKDLKDSTPVPKYVNSVEAPPPQDAGVVAEPPPEVNVNSPPPTKPKPEPKHVNSPKPKTK